MSKKEDEEEDIKVILVGEPGTGKTSLINVAIGKMFTDNSPSTLISTFVQKKFNKNNKEYILNIWDTAGQEKFRAMTKIFIKNSKIVILVYSINSKETYDGLKEYWFNIITEALGDEPIIAMVGNKSDLFLEEQIKEEEAKEFARENGIKFKLVSAKEDPDGFIEFLEELLDEYLRLNNKDTLKRETININSDSDKTHKGCCK
jgi:small GTP-binding protein